MELELWLDRSEGLLLQALITGQVMDSDDADTVRLLTLKDIDIPVDGFALKVGLDAKSPRLMQKIELPR